MSQFCIYRGNQSRHGYEFARLDQLTVSSGFSELMFDGTLTVGEEERYVQKVKFQILTLEGYGDYSFSVQKNFCIQSYVGGQSEVWYRLAQPSAEYSRFYKPFTWLGHFTKQFVDYLTWLPTAVLRHFRSDFYEWMIKRHRGDVAFQSWFSEFGNQDFATVVVANVAFLWKETNSIIPDAAKLPIWREVDYLQLAAIPSQLRVQKKTIVTPYIRQCFEHMYFSKFLQSLCPEEIVLKAWQRRILSLGFGSGSHSEGFVKEPRGRAIDREFQVGDVVVVGRDQISDWKDQAQTWTAYVQGSENRRGIQLLSIIWLYRPEDTTLANTVYPYSRELFMSDHCNCDTFHTAKLKSSDVLGIVDVDWFVGGSGRTHPDHFFVRQKYHSEDNSFSSLGKNDFRCACGVLPTHLENVMMHCSIGDTVLIEQRCDGGKILEPVQIIDFVLEEEKILVRRLLRRKRDLRHEGASPNELVFTDEHFRVAAKAYRRKCNIRFFSADANVTTPYNRQGTGDFYFIKTQLVKDGSGVHLMDLQLPFPASLNNGFDPDVEGARKPLNGLSLFCGGGNFDRGLEESGVIRTRWAVDIDERAQHTYRLNAKFAGTRFYFGSVDDFLAEAMRGPGHDFPAIGEIDFISAGSPCQGYSSAQPNKQSETSKKNASLITSVLSFIDLYRPKHALLENVVAMASGIGKRKENVFAQVLSSLVAMGYQVQQFQLDAWSFGAPQSRTRLFILATAPGLTQPKEPPHTHSHPPWVVNRSLGKAVSGMPFGTRQFEATPFPYVTAQEATKDLPFIGDSKVQACIPFPDHRTCREESGLTRCLISSIPVVPDNSSMVKAMQQGLLPRPLMDLFDRQGPHRRSAISKAWQRISADGLIPTITTSIMPADSFTGRCLHWEQHRLITVMEARRAQGFPDEEVLIGLPRHQWKIIGNSVARQVALALGMSIREAWLANTPDADEEEIIPGGKSEPGGTEEGARVLDGRRDVDSDSADELTITHIVSLTRQFTRKKSISGRNSVNTVEVTSTTTVRRFEG